MLDARSVLFVTGNRTARHRMAPVKKSAAAAFAAAGLGLATTALSASVATADPPARRTP